MKKKKVSSDQDLEDYIHLKCELDRDQFPDLIKIMILIKFPTIKKLEVGYDKDGMISVRFIPDMENQRSDVETELINFTKEIKKGKEWKGGF